MEQISVTIVQRPDGLYIEEGHNEHPKLRHSHTVFLESDLEHIKKHTKEERTRILYDFLP